MDPGADWGVEMGCGLGASGGEGRMMGLGE